MSFFTSKAEKSPCYLTLMARRKVQFYLYHTAYFVYIAVSTNVLQSEYQLDYFWLHKFILVHLCWKL
jgi:hypothetical protein